MQVGGVAFVGAEGEQRLLDVNDALKSSRVEEGALVLQVHVRGVQLLSNASSQPAALAVNQEAGVARPTSGAASAQCPVAGHAVEVRQQRGHLAGLALVGVLALVQPGVDEVSHWKSACMTQYTGSGSPRKASV